MVPDATMPAELSPVEMIPSLTLMDVGIVGSRSGLPKPAVLLPKASSPTVMLPLLRAYAVVPGANSAALIDNNPFVWNRRS